MSFPLRRGALASAGVTLVACVAVHILNMASIVSFVNVESPALIDAGTCPGTDGAMLLAPLTCGHTGLWLVGSLELQSFLSMLPWLLIGDIIFPVAC